MRSFVVVGYMLVSCSGCRDISPFLFENNPAGLYVFMNLPSPSDASVQESFSNELCEWIRVNSTSLVQLYGKK